VGTIWGPHVLHGREQPARRPHTRTPPVSALTSGDAYPYVLGIKCATRGLRQEAVSSMAAPSAARCTASQPFLAAAFVS